MDKELNEYISTHYSQWVECAHRYIRRSKLLLDPTEVVNEVLYRALDKNKSELYRLLCISTKQKPELDYFVRYIIKISIYSPRSPIRYQRGGYCTVRLGSRDPNIVANEEPCEHEVFLQTIQHALDQIEAPELGKKLFAWKFFEGRPISKWPGPESRRIRYRDYADTLTAVREYIKGKKAK